MVLSEGIVDIPAKQTILIPSHHDPVELFGTEYVPIIFTNHGATGGTLIKYSDFKKYVEKKLRKPMKITKEAGVFICRK